MTLKHVDGFDQFQGQSDASLLSSLTSAGYSTATGVAIAAGRKTSSFSLELQVTPGAAGANWSSRTNTAKSDLRGVAANDSGRWVAVGDAGTALGSDDSQSWATVVLGISTNLKDIGAHVNTYIAVGDAGTVMRSTDGRNFTQIIFPSNTVSLKAVKYGGGKWVAIGANGTAGAIYISSDDGLNWSAAIGQGASPNIALDYGNGLWMVGGFSGQMLTSTDGLNFGTLASGVVQNISAVAYGSGTWLLGVLQDVRASLNSGASWTTIATGVVTNGSVTAIKNAGTRWVLTGEAGVIRISDNAGVSWAIPDGPISNVTVNAVAVSSGALAGWCVVGAKAVAGLPTSAPVIYMSLSPPTKFSRVLTSSAQKVVIGFAHRSTLRGRILSITGLLDMDWPAGIRILNTDGAAIPARNVWYYYEITIDKVANQLTLHINNTLDMTAPLPAGAADLESYEIVWQAENGAISRIDDIYLLDNTTTGGAALVSRMGPISVPIRVPTADATPNNWVGSTVGPHWPLIGLLPPSATSYVRSSVAGAQDLYLSDDPLPAGAGSAEQPILAVGMLVLASKGDIDARQLGLVVGAPGAQKEVIDTTLSTSPEYSYAVFEKAPGDTPWDATNILTTPFGVVVRP